MFIMPAPLLTVFMLRGAVSTAANATITSISPPRVALEGGDDVTVVGAGFVAGSAPLCRIDPPGSGTTHVLTNPLPFPARLINSTHAVCESVPAVAAAGPGLLMISMDGKTWSGSGGLGNRITYYNLVDVAIGRRPYVSEAMGELLLRTDHAALAGVPLLVSAALPAAGPAAHWSWSAVGGVDVSLPMELELLGPSTDPLHNDLVVNVSWATRLVTKFRRFHRVPPPASSSRVEVVQVDHASRGLRVSGREWAGVGWYLAAASPTSWNNSLEVLARHVAADSARGVNQGMVYGLMTRPAEEQLRFLDACAAVGFKVMYDLGTGLNVSINHGGPFDRPTLLDALIANVTLVRHHPCAAASRSHSRWVQRSSQATPRQHTADRNPASQWLHDSYMAIT